MTAHRLRLLVALLWLALASQADAGPAKDPLARWQARVDQAKLATLPPPAPGVRDVSWQSMLDETWDQPAIAGTVPTASAGTASASGAPRAAATSGAPAVSPPPVPTTGPVRLTGFVTVLDSTAGSARTALLAPYPLMHSERPAPPGRQMVLVALAYAFPDHMQGQPVWVTGKLLRQSTPTPFGTAAYLIVGARWQPYPHQKYRLPPYQMPGP